MQKGFVCVEEKCANEDKLLSTVSKGSGSEGGPAMYDSEALPSGIQSPGVEPESTTILKNLRATYFLEMDFA